jgi:hypothetical protein
MSIMRVILNTCNACGGFFNTGRGKEHSRRLNGFCEESGFSGTRGREEHIKDFGCWLRVCRCTQERTDIDVICFRFCDHVKALQERMNITMHTVIL